MADDDRDWQVSNDLFTAPSKVLRSHISDDMDCWLTIRKSFYCVECISTEVCSNQMTKDEKLMEISND